MSQQIVVVQYLHRQHTHTHHSSLGGPGHPHSKDDLMITASAWRIAGLTQSAADWDALGPVSRCCHSPCSYHPPLSQVLHITWSHLPLTVDWRTGGASPWERLVSSPIILYKYKYNEIFTTKFCYSNSSTQPTVNTRKNNIVIALANSLVQTAYKLSNYRRLPYAPVLSFLICGFCIYLYVQCQFTNS